MTARDFAQTLELCERLGDRAHGDRPPPRRARSRAKAAGLASRSAALAALGARGRGRVRHRARPRLQRRHGRGRAAADPRARRCSTTSGRRSSTTSTAGWRAAVVVPDAIPPERLRPLRRARQAAPLRGAEGGVLPGRLRARRRRCSHELGLDRGAPDRRRAHAARGLALPPLRERPVRARARAPARRAPTGRAAGRAAARRRAARGAARGVAGFVVPERAIDAQSLIAYADLVISAGGTMNREAVALGTPVLHDVRGAPRRGRRAADRRRPPAAPAATPSELELAAASARARPRACGATRRCSSSCCWRRWRGASSGRAARSSRPAAYNLRNAPTDPLGGPSRSTVTRCRSSRWTGRWSRSRTTSPSSCASNNGPPRALRRAARGDDLVGARRAACRCSCSARVYQRRWRYAGQRDYEAVVRAVVRDRAADGRRPIAVARTRSDASAATATTHRRGRAARTA